MLVDSHCHLDFPEFNNSDSGGQASVVARAKAAGVGRLLTISTHISRFAGVLAAAEAFDLARRTPGWENLAG